LTASFSEISVPSGNEVSETRPANSLYFPALDGVRALAILMVFGQHYLQLLWGWAGVDVFFVLSGFLITGILFDTSGQQHRVRNFYVRRTLRIFPLYYGLMLLLALLYPLFRWRWSWTWLLWPAYVGNFCRGIHPFALGSAMQMLADFQPLSATFPHIQLYLGHFWSLCVEEQFYLVWPWVVFWIRDRRKLMYLCLAAVVICPLMRVVCSHTLPQFMLEQEVLYRWTPFRVDALLLGGLVALVWRGPSWRRLLMLARAGFCLLFTAMIGYLAYGALHRGMGYAHPNPVWANTWGLLLVDVFSACLIAMALEPGSIAFRVFSLRPLRWLGRISYGAYVFHDIYHLEIINWMRHITTHVEYGTALVGFPLTLLLAWASYRWFETPFIRLKERWTRSPLAVRTVE
jgi:peptidoglycan/LPS O-acetylase OafA/YrhL